MWQALGLVSFAVILAAFVALLVGLVIGIARKRWRVLKWSAATCGVAFLLLVVAIAFDTASDNSESALTSPQTSDSAATPSPDFTPLPTPPPEPATMPVQEPLIPPRVTAGQLIEIKSGNEVAFESKYVDQVHRIVGLVSSVQRAGEHIDVKLQGRRNTIAEVVCKVSGDWKEAADIQVNTTATVEGLVTNKGVFDLVVDDCSVVIGIVAATDFHVPVSSSWDAEAKTQVDEFNSLVGQAVEAGDTCATDCSRCFEIGGIMAQIDSIVGDALASGEWGQDFKLASAALGASLSKHQSNSIALIKTDVGLGSGVVVSPAGLLLTNEHVVGDADFVDVQLPSGCVLVGEVVKVDEDIDLALVQLPDDLVYLHLPFADRIVKPSDAVSVWGYPLSSELGYDPKHTQGEVERVSTEQLTLNVVANHGSSGGPVLNESDHVVGIVRAKSLFSNQIAAVPLDVAREFTDAGVAEAVDATVELITEKRILWVKVLPHENPYIDLRVQVDPEFDLSNGWHTVYVNGVREIWTDAIYADQSYLQIGTMDGSLSPDLRVSVSTDGYGDYRCEADSQSDTEFVFRCIER